MAFKIEIERLAEEEFLEAVLYYEMQRSGLGNDLILCYEEALATIIRNPFFEVRIENVRLYNIRRFPYQIIYYIENESIFIIGFFNAHRDPIQWQNRIK